MFPLTISKLQLCFEMDSYAAVGVHKNAPSAFWPSKMVCYFLIIFSLASNQKANYLIESHAELCSCVCPTQQYWCSTLTSLWSSQGCLSLYDKHRQLALHCG